MKRVATIFLIVVLTARPTVADAQSDPLLRFGVEAAESIVDTVRQRATDLDSPGAAIAVVDAGGHLLAFARLDGTFPASAKIAVGKACTAAMFRKPTSAFEEIVNKGRTSMVALQDFTPLKGGVPIMIDNVVVGAVGVSGAATADQDEELAVFAANAFCSRACESTKADISPRAMKTEFIAKKVVDAAWQKGAPLIENSRFKVHASRRDQPGQAEVHDDETDVVYVVSGTATLVTGGTVFEPATVAPGETRGSRIDNGDVHELVPGDVIVIPAGTPHWFQSVEGPFLYFVVKPVDRQE